MTPEQENRLAQLTEAANVRDAFLSGEWALAEARRVEVEKAYRATFARVLREEWGAGIGSFVWTTRRGLTTKWLVTSLGSLGSHKPTAWDLSRDTHLLNGRRIKRNGMPEERERLIPAGWRAAE